MLTQDLPPGKATGIAEPRAPAPPPAAAPQAGKRFRFSLRHYLVALVLATLLPVLVITAAAVMQTGKAYRAAALQDLQTIARIVSVAMRREVVTTVDMLSELALLHALEQGSGLERSVEALALPFGASRISLVPATASSVAPGTGMDPVSQQALIAAAATATWQISNLSQPGDGAGHVAVAVPYRSPAGESGTLLLEAPPDRIIRGFTRGPMTPPELAERLLAVIDGNGRVLAHSRDPRQIGTTVADWEHLLADERDQGVFEGGRVGDEPAVFGFSRIARTPGWTAVVGEPRSVLDARWSQPQAWLLGGAVVALLLALLLAAGVARLLLNPVQALVRRTQGITAGTRAAAGVTPGRWSIIEIDTLRDTVEAAGSVMSERIETVHRRAEQALHDKRRYRILAQANALVIWRRSPDGVMAAIVGWQELTGQKPEEMSTRWLESVHGDDRAELQRAWQHGKASGLPLDVELRIRTDTGTWRWMRARGAPVLDDAGELLEWIGVLEDVDARRREQERIAHLAMHDSLTGLPNRTVFHEQLVRAIELAGRGETGLLFYIDLDEFKQVNDGHGHAVGDALLRAVASRLRALVRRTDTVARLGGDEFAIIQATRTGEMQESDLPARLAAAMSQVFVVENIAIRTSASIGVVRIRSHHQDPERLLRQADIALYSAKAEGGGRYMWFDESSDSPESTGR